MIKYSILHKVIFLTILLGLLILSLSLWLNTPDLFNYFNQAFCAH